MTVDTEHPIRVLEVVDHLGAGGAQELLLGLARYADRQALDLAFCALHGQGSYVREIAGLGHPVWSLRPRRLDPRIPLDLLRCLVQGRYDLVHCHLEVSSLLGPLLGRLARTPRAVVTVHGIRSQCAPWFFPLLRFLSPLVDRFVAEVHRSEDELQGAGIPPAKIVYIPIGTDYPLLLAQGRGGDSQAVRREFGWSAETPLILNIARLHPHKGQLLLLDAIVDVLAARPDARLLLVGDGPLRPVLEATVEREGLTGRVILAGFRRDLLNLYAACDLLAISSVNEALGVNTIQAMAHAKPVVAFDVGAMREAVVPEQTGLLVPVGDAEALAQAIVRLVSDKALRERLGRAARDLVSQHYRLDRLIRDHETLYRTLVTGSGGLL